MENIYANDFAGIPTALAQNADLLHVVLALIATEPIAGKVTEGGDRLQVFRGILADLVEGKIDLGTAFDQTEVKLPRHASEYSGSNRVFAANWAERLVRTQYSRFYNQAVMETLLANGETLCFIPHSSSEDSSSACSRQLAGSNQDLRTLYERIKQSYAHGIWNQTVVKIPDHPHCTHVVVPSKS